jgi:hypothetical protein
VKRGEKRSGWLVRTALVAGITFSLTMAVVGGVLFGRAVTSSPAETPPERTVERAPVDQRSAKPEKPEPKDWPVEGAVADAERIARSRDGVVSFAAVGPDGTAVGYEPDRQFYSASVSKSMLLVAELRRLRREGTPLDQPTRSLLEQMITVSDNDAADAIYERVGDPGLDEVAEAAGMSHFGGDVGHWSNVKITAADMALFMSKLDKLLALPYGGAGSEMLASVTPLQRWGIPQAAPDDADVRLKGGWRPSETGQLVHQAASVEIDGETYALAVLSDGNPSQVYGQETIRLIAAQLLRGVDAAD